LQSVVEQQDEDDGKERAIDRWMIKSQSFGFRQSSERSLYAWCCVSERAAGSSDPEKNEATFEQ
jgi:hypothetical protein